MSFEEQAIARRVAARFKVAAGLSVGESKEKGSIRVHRFMGIVKIWDLTNAGKRGKKVRVMALEIHAPRDEEAQWLSSVSSMALAYGSYDNVKTMVSHMMNDQPKIEMHEHQERGIDVLPANVKTIKLNWTVERDERLRLEATPLKFTVTSSEPISRSSGESIGRQDTGYWPRKRAGAKKFYVWLLNNESKITKMGIRDLRKVWDKLGIAYDWH